MDHRFLKNTESFVLVAIVLFALSGCGVSAKAPEETLPAYVNTPSDLTGTETAKTLETEEGAESETAETEETAENTADTDEVLYKNEENEPESKIKTEGETSAADVVGYPYRYYIQYPDAVKIDVTDAIRVEATEGPGFAYYVKLDTVLDSYGTEEMTASEIAGNYGKHLEEHGLDSSLFHGKWGEGGTSCIVSEDESVYGFRRPLMRDLYYSVTDETDDCIVEFGGEKYVPVEMLNRLLFSGSFGRIETKFPQLRTEMLEDSVIFRYDTAVGHEEDRKSFNKGYDCSQIPVWEDGEEKILADIIPDTGLVFLKKKSCKDCLQYNDVIMEQLDQASVKTMVIELTKEPEDEPLFATKSEYVKDLGINEVPAVMSIVNGKAFDLVEHPHFSDNAAEVSVLAEEIERILGQDGQEGE